MAEKKSFEKTMAELARVVDQLENGQPELDLALSLFEKGIKLTRECQKMLETAEQKVTKLMQDAGGDIVETPFE